MGQHEKSPFLKALVGPFYLFEANSWPAIDLAVWNLGHIKGRYDQKSVPTLRQTLLFIGFSRLSRLYSIDSI